MALIFFVWLPYHLKPRTSKLMKKNIWENKSRKNKNKKNNTKKGKKIEVKELKNKNL